MLVIYPFGICVAQESVVSLKPSLSAQSTCASKVKLLSCFLKPQTFHSKFKKETALTRPHDPCHKEILKLAVDALRPNVQRKG